MPGPFVIDDPAPQDPTLAATGFDRLPSGTGTDFAYDFLQGPTGAILRGIEQAEPNYGPIIAGGRGGVLRAAPTSPLLDPETANQQYGLDGELHWDQPVRQDEAKLLNGWKVEELQRQDVLRRADRGLIAGGERLGSSFLAGALDPINVASAFVPVVGEARYAQWAGRFGTAGARLLQGAAEGSAGAAATEPLILAQASRQQQDYSAYDALTNLAFGAALGGGLHVGLGALGDRLLGRRPGSLLDSVHADGEGNVGLQGDPAVPQPADLNPFRTSYRQRLMGSAAAIDDMPIERRQALLQGAVAALVEGRPVDVGDLVTAERTAIGNAYDSVRAAPLAGQPDEVMAEIRPDEFNRLIVQRGAAIDRNGQLVVSGRELQRVFGTRSNYGLVKFIFRHGEESAKLPDLRTTRDDVMALPDVVRRYEPTVDTVNQAGTVQREWRVQRDGHVVVYGTSRLADGRDTVVTIYRQDPARPGADAPLSQEKTGTGSGSQDRVVSPASLDTAPGSFSPDGEPQPVPASRNIGRVVALRKDGTPAVYRDQVPAEKWAAKLNERAPADPVTVTQLGDGTFALMRDTETEPVLTGFKTKRAAEKALAQYSDPQGRDLAIVPDHSGAGRRSWSIVAGHAGDDLAAIAARPDLARLAERTSDFDARVAAGRAASAQIMRRAEFRQALSEIIQRHRLYAGDPEDVRGILDVARRTAGDADAATGRVNAVHGSLQEAEQDLAALTRQVEEGRRLGRLSPEDDAELAAGDQVVQEAEMKARAREVGARCMAGAR